MNVEGDVLKSNHTATTKRTTMDNKARKLFFGPADYFNIVGGSRENMLNEDNLYEAHGTFVPTATPLAAKTNLHDTRGNYPGCACKGPFRYHDKDTRPRSRKYSGRNHYPN